MPITFRDATANRLMTELYYQDGGTRRTIIGAWYQDGGTRREVFSLVAVSPTSASGFVLDIGGPSSATVTSDSVTASGASTYSWARISGSTGISATAVNSATTAFTATVDASVPLEAVFRVTGDNGGTFDVPVELTYSNS